MEADQRPVRYLTNGKDSQEEMAREIARCDGVGSGSVCAFTAVEPGLTGRVAGDRDTRKLRLVPTVRPGLHVYHYWIDPLFGFMSARLWTNS